jgi:hypothetical protein
VTSDDPGIAQDKKASVIINYGLSDIPAARVIRDEMRRVSSLSGQLISCECGLKSCPLNHSALLDFILWMPRTVAQQNQQSHDKPYDDVGRGSDY